MLKNRVRVRVLCVCGMERRFQGLSITATKYAPLLRRLADVSMDADNMETDLQRDDLEGDDFLGSLVGPGQAEQPDKVQAEQPDNKRRRGGEEANNNGSENVASVVPPGSTPPSQTPLVVQQRPPANMAENVAVSTSFSDAQFRWSLKAQLPPRIELVPGTNFTPILYKLYTILGTVHGKLLYKRAMRTNMRFKVLKYRGLRKDAAKQANDMASMVKEQQRRLIAESGATKAQAAWDAYEKVSGGLSDLQREVEVFRELENAAIRLLKEENGALDTDGLDPNKDTHILDKCDKLRASLEELTVYNQQADVLDTIGEVVLMFLNNPFTVRDRFMNFLFLGAAGTGKTTLVRQISKVFVSAGLFVFDTVREAGRGEFIAPYEGQTVGRTMNFLKNSLDRGVIFIDEAYSITTWKDGQCDGYGQEAASAIVEFMTKYKGLYCLMAAGYQKEMSRYFLPANPGLSRRFTYRAVIRDYSASQLVNVFKRKILEEQGIEVDGFDPTSILPADQFFLDGAWIWLERAVELALLVDERLKPADPQNKNSYAGYELDKKNMVEYTDVKENKPRLKYIYEVFKAQAGAMANLAEEFALFVSVEKDSEGLARLPVGRKQGKRVTGKDGNEYAPPWNGSAVVTNNDLQIVDDNRLSVAFDHDIDDMKDLVKNRLYKMNTGDLGELETEWVGFDKAVMAKVTAHYFYINAANQDFTNQGTQRERRSLSRKTSSVGNVEDDIKQKYDYEEPEWEKSLRQKPKPRPEPMPEPELEAEEEEGTGEDNPAPDTVIENNGRRTTRVTNKRFDKIHDHKDTPEDRQRAASARAAVAKMIMDGS